MNPITLAANFTKALATHIADGCTKVELPVYQARLEACTACEHIKPPNTCGLCGCGLSLKASWRTSKCPANKWPDSDASPGAQPNE